MSEEALRHIRLHLLETVFGFELLFVVKQRTKVYLSKFFTEQKLKLKIIERIILRMEIFSFYFYEYVMEKC